MSNKPKKKKKKKVTRALAAEKYELAMIEGIVEGSPDAVGVAVVRLECSCRKMAAVSKLGEPASKVIMYRDSFESICDQCKEDDGSFARVKEEFIHWLQPEPDDALKRQIEEKVLGVRTVH